MDVVVTPLARGRLVGSTCKHAIPGNTEDARFMDSTPMTFDNDYWKGLARARCPKKRVGAEDYDRCTASYLTSDWTGSRDPEWTKQSEPPVGALLQSFTRTRTRVI